MALTLLTPAELQDSHGTEAGARQMDGGGRPNILLITTDDQNRGDLRWMAETRRLIGGHGVTFTRALAQDPLCCPSRAELLTGQLGQNNGVRENVGPRGGFHALLDRRNTLARWLQDSGYRTAMVGKYLNGYLYRYGKQKGWTIWNPEINGLYSYTDTTFFGVRRPVHFTSNVTPVISRYTVSYIHRFARSSRPFFIWASHVAPHGRAVVLDKWAPPLPTRRHRDDLSGVPAPTVRKPSFDRLGTPPRPYPGLAHAVSRRHAQAEFTRRLQSLLDVSDAVDQAIKALRETGQLRDTYIFFTSDNANLLGEHGIDGKNVLYREALEIPLLVRVPGADHGRLSSLPVSPTDLTATITDLAGAAAGRQQDGRSLVPILEGRPVHWRDTQLIQTGDERGRWSFRGVWTPRYSYFRRVRDGVSFLYDHRRDPYELHNVARTPSYHRVLAELRHRTAVLSACAGASCNQRFGRPPPPR